jgi:transposase
MLENDSNILGDLYKTCKDAKEKIRYAALYAVSRGNNVKTVADIMAVEESTVYDWINKWIFEKNLSDKPRSGRPAKLTEADKEEIKRVVDENDPAKYGINSLTYTTAELQEYFRRMHDKTINQESLRVALHELGGRFIKAQIVYKEADIEKQIEFAKTFFDLTVNWGFDKIVFVDEMHVWTSARSRYGWTFNERLVVAAPQSKKGGKLGANYFGAVEVMKGKVTQLVDEDPKAPTMIKLLKMLKKRYKDDKVLLCWDGGKVHKAKIVKEFLQNEMSNFHLLPLPPYSPDLDPEEHVHNHLRDKLLGNRNFSSIEHVREVIAQHTKRLSLDKVRGLASLIPIEMLLSFQDVS